MNHHRWMRPIFGPFRRQRTGAPADHFPKARMGRYGDAITVLIAEGAGGAGGTVTVVEGGLATLDFGAMPPGTQPIAAPPGTPDANPEPLPDPEPPPEPERPEPLSASHAAFVGRHSHAHATGVGVQGDDRTHVHSHSHRGDAIHVAHEHGASIQQVERGGMSAGRDPEKEITDPTQLAAMVASALTSRGVTAATNAAGDVEPAAFHAYLCAEGVRTDDGREILPGACRFPDLPVSLRLLIEDEGGHWGAVTCGRIDTMDRQDAQGLPMIYATGIFGSDPNGQLAELLVEEQTQRFISIDPRDVTGEWIEVEINVSSGMFDNDDDGGLYDCWFRMSDLVIGAATIVATPALPQAVITLSTVELPEAPLAIESAPPGLPQILASGAPVAPPAAWFEDPGFHVGDARLVRQPDGRSYACPLTVTDDGRVFGHLASWNSRHTGFPGRDVRPPRSKSGYAHYLTGGCPCDVPDCEHAVGQVTMGCGHAPLTKSASGRPIPLAAHEVVAHYDGGYGAVQMADVTVGEDDFGPWIAGALKPGVTPEQIRDFTAMGLSGDWREMAGSLDLLAILSVPAPGFPISRRALAASGAPSGEELELATRAGIADDRVFALVAAGVVRRVSPDERIAVLEREILGLRDLVAPLVRSFARSRLG